MNPRYTSTIPHELRYLTTEVRRATEREINQLPRERVALADVAVVSHLILAFTTLTALHANVIAAAEIDVIETRTQLDIALVSIGNAVAATAGREPTLDGLSMVSNEIDVRLANALYAVEIAQASKENK